MKKLFLIPLAVLPLMLSSCATPQPPQAYVPTDNSALVISAIDGQHSRILMPTPSAVMANGDVLAMAKDLPHHTTAVVILENYTEPTIGPQFRDRGTPWFMGLRVMGYDNIVFLQGNGSESPAGLLTLARYE